MGDKRQTANIMSRLSLFLILCAAAGLGWLGFEFTGWRSGKLASLEPPPAVQMVAVSPEMPASLLLFGDSRVRQWAPLPPRPYTIAVEGFPGETAIRLQPRLRTALEAHRPGKVMVQAGINDAVAASLVGSERRARAIGQSLAALEQMAVDSRAAGAELVFLKVLPPVRPDLVRRLVYRSHIDSYVAALNAAMPGIAARHGATVIDPLPLLLDENGAVPDHYRKDALHLTPMAYEALGVLLPPSIEVRG